MKGLVNSESQEFLTSRNHKSKSGGACCFYQISNESELYISTAALLYSLTKSDPHLDLSFDDEMRFV